MWKLFSSYHINNLWLWRKWTRRASNAARTIIYHQTLKIKRKKWNVMRHNNENDWTSIICVCVGEIWMLMEDSFVWWRETEEEIKMKDISSATIWTFLQNVLSLMYVSDFSQVLHWDAQYSFVLISLYIYALLLSYHTKCIEERCKTRYFCNNIFNTSFVTTFHFISYYKTSVFVCGLKMLNARIKNK